MRRTPVLPLAAVAALTLVAALGTASGAGADPRPDFVTVWNSTMIDALETAKTPPPPAMRIGAIVQSSVFDALNGVERKYTPIHVEPAAPPGASRDAAVVEAAYEALVVLFPPQKATFDAQLAASLAQIGGGPNDQSVQRGLSWGKQVADEILAWRAGDGISAVLPPYVPGGTPGDWAPTPPGFSTQPVFRQFGNMTPWAMTSPSQFLPTGPPALTSTRYTQDFNEVKTIGSASSATRTALQTETALFWNGDPPVILWDRLADDLAEANHLTLTDNARLLARTNVAMADAVIAIWNAKNTFNRWRPITAIQQAGTDGNPDTAADPGWTPFIVTPVHQEYPSGHAGVSSAAASTLASFYGDDTSFSMTSFGLPGVVHTFTSFSSAVAEVSDARVFAGIHFRFSCDDAVLMGTGIADLVDHSVGVRVHGSDH
jgi:PAP2 superfamily protein